MRNIYSFEIKIESSPNLPVLMYFQLILSCFAVTHIDDDFTQGRLRLYRVYLRLSWAKSRIPAKK